MKTAREIVQYRVTYEYGFTVFVSRPYDSRAEAACYRDDIASYIMLQNAQIIRVTKRKKNSE